jgi:hypothetical protein
MAEFSFRLLRPLLVAVVGVAGLGGPVLGQDTAPSTVTNPYTVSVVSAPSPYWGYSSNPYGGYLHGVADVTRAQGQWLLYQQEAIRLREKNRQEKVVSRRMEIEHWVWEREFLAEARKRERERIREEERERSRTTPPLTEILSAYSLNFLLHELKQNPGLAAAGSIPVEAEWLDHVHVTYVTTGAGGNVGLLKGNRIPWGVLLRGKDYHADREEVERLVAQAKKEVRAGGASAETIVDLRQRLDALTARIERAARSDRDDSCTPSDFVRAARSLRDLKAAVLMLQEEDAAFYLDSLQGKNVAELVEYMKSKGLSFAPATAGCERFYVALHRALADEYNRVQQK